MKNLLLLGGCGFIATNIAIEAIKRGYKVTAFDNLRRNEVKDNLNYMESKYKDKYIFVWGDVRKAGDFDSIGEVDAIINLAANPSVVGSIKDPIYDFETNTGGTVNALEFSRERGSLPFIQASTNKVFSDLTNEIPFIEDETKYRWKGSSALISTGLDFSGVTHVPEAINDRFPIDGFCKYGHSIYGASKASADLYCQEYHIQYGIPMVIFRMSCIYGLFQKGVEEQAWIDWFLKQIAFGDGKISIFGTGKQVRDILDGRDTARAYLDALEKMDEASGNIFTLGGGPANSYSLLDVIKKIEELTDRKAELSFHDKRPADQDIYISSIKKVGAILNWKPAIGLEEAINDMIDQYEGVCK